MRRTNPFVCKRTGFWTLALALAAFAASPAKVQAGPVYSFDNISNNSGISDTLGSQFTVEVDAVGTTQVSFLFKNLGPVASKIMQIYFDDGALLGIASVTNGAGVSFAQGGSPGNLPEGNTVDPAFVASAGFLATADPGASNGVDPGEQVTITFNLQAGKTSADVIAAIEAGLLLAPGSDPDSPIDTLRIGIHVQSIGTESDSFINDGNGVVPEPSTVALAAVGLAGLGATRLRKRKGAQTVSRDS